jgi:murein L,D-transpeptidase YcbB/YkuD
MRSSAIPAGYSESLARAQERAGLPPDGLRGPRTRRAGL